MIIKFPVMMKCRGNPRGCPLWVGLTFVVALMSERREGNHKGCPYLENHPDGITIKFPSETWELWNCPKYCKKDY